MSKKNLPIATASEWLEGSDVGLEEREQTPYPETAIVPYFQKKGGFFIYKDFDTVQDGDISFRRPIPRGRPLKFVKAQKNRVQLGLTHANQTHFTAPRGLIILYAGTGVGKSFFKNELAKRSKRILPLRATEPHDDESEVEQSLDFFEADDALEYGFAMWARNREVIPFIDSLRGPLFETSGAAGEKGVIMAFFTALTKVSTALAKQGCTMIATLNPMSNNPEQQKIVETYLRASVPAVIQLNSIRDGVFSGVLTVRDYDNYRTPTEFTMVASKSKEKLPDMDISHLISVPAPAEEPIALIDAALVSTLK